MTNEVISGDIEEAIIASQPDRPPKFTVWGTIHEIFTTTEQLDLSMGG